MSIWEQRMQVIADAPFCSDAAEMVAQCVAIVDSIVEKRWSNQQLAGLSGNNGHANGHSLIESDVSWEWIAGCSLTCLRHHDQTDVFDWGSEEQHDRGVALSRVQLIRCGQLADEVESGRWTKAAEACRSTVP